ncbi:MAG: gephyrin-like molybdotransferase Glp [Thermomicrobiales bacterium]
MGVPGADDGMIGVAEALERVMAGVAPLSAEEVALGDALGRVLAEDVVSGEDIPPFRNSAMDGYAVRADDVRGASRATPVRLRVVGQGPAGYPASGAVGEGTAIRIMTGAPLPPGADTVVRFEETDNRTDEVAIFAEQRAWVNVREAGEDVRAGETVLRAGCALRPIEIGVLASTGRATVTVFRRPRVAIVSTGDEVAALGQPVRPGQIRDSNSHTLAALVRRYGGEPELLGVARDTVGELTAALRAAREADLILTSGGVSVGDYDMVKDVLRAEGRIEIWQVRMKPGRPLAFGYLGERPFLGLPGNPVAAYVSFEVFARPVILRQAGRAEWRKPTVRARLAEDIDNRGGRQHYVRALVTPGEDVPMVRPTGEQGSGVLTALVRANALLVVPDGVERLPAGALVEVELLHEGGM